MKPQPIIDQTTFDALKEAMGAEFLPELVSAYFDEMPILLSKLHQALAKQDCDAFRQAAHSIKSTSNSFGALEFGALAKELEMMGREVNLDGAPAKVEALTSGYELVRQALEGLTHG